MPLTRTTQISNINPILKGKCGAAEDRNSEQMPSTKLLRLASWQQGRTSSKHSHPQEPVRDLTLQTSTFGTVASNMSGELQWTDFRHARENLSELTLAPLPLNVNTKRRPHGPLRAPQAPFEPAEPLLSEAARDT